MRFGRLQQITNTLPSHKLIFMNFYLKHVNKGKIFFDYIKHLFRPDRDSPTSARSMYFYPLFYCGRSVNFNWASPIKYVVCSFPAKASAIQELYACAYNNSKKQPNPFTFVCMWMYDAGPTEYYKVQVPVQEQVSGNNLIHSITTYCTTLYCWLGNVTTQGRRDGIQGSSKRK